MEITTDLAGTIITATLQQRAIVMAVLPVETMEDLAGIITMVILHKLAIMAINLPEEVLDIITIEAVIQHSWVMAAQVLPVEITMDLAGTIITEILHKPEIIVLPEQVSGIITMEAIPQQLEKVTAAALQQENTNLAGIITMAILHKPVVMAIVLPEEVSNIIITGVIPHKRIPVKITVLPRIIKAAIASLARMILPVMIQQRQRRLAVKATEEMVTITHRRQREIFLLTIPIGVLPS